ncbi:flagellar basal-body MS-ring/collar protein FliF [candidate division KSB1 bacterium]
MAEFLNQFFKQSKNVFGKLDSKQKLAVLVVSIFSVAVIVYLMTWTGERQWKLLHSNLRSEDVSGIIEYLKENNVPYKLETEGSAILVPQGQELELRIEVETQGLVTGGTVGYEIFDRPNIGMTDYVQQLQGKRALEGEIARTIQDLEMVDYASVTITVPKEYMYIQDQKPNEASVLLTLTAGAQLSQEQLNVIHSLVARSVEGLEAKNVQITDQYGNDLSKSINKDPLTNLKSEQLKIQASYEMEKRNKIENILTDILGPGNAKVEVTVDMDFSIVDEVSKSYPTTAESVVRSEQQESSQGTQPDSVRTPSTDERTITNYEVTEVTTNTRRPYGQVMRQTVTVLVNGRWIDPDELGYVDPGDGTSMYQPIEQPELGVIETSIKNAVGFVEGRDEVSVLDFQFDVTIFEDQAQLIEDEQFKENLRNIIKWFLMGVAGIAFVFVLRSVFRSLDMLLPKPKPKPAIDIEAEAIEEEISAEAQRRAQMLDQVSKFTREKPTNVASLLNSWLVEEKA